MLTKLLKLRPEVQGATMNVLISLGTFMGLIYYNMVGLIYYDWAIALLMLSVCSALMSKMWLKTMCKVKLGNKVFILCLLVFNGCAILFSPMLTGLNLLNAYQSGSDNVYTFNNICNF